MHDANFMASLARFLVAAVLLQAGVAKLIAPAEFRASVAEYHLLPPGIVPMISRAIPIAEITGGALLAGGIAIRVASSAMALLLAGFSVAVAINLIRGRAIDCGCAGGAPRPISLMHIAYNAGLIILCGLLAVRFTGIGLSMSVWADSAPALLTLAVAAVINSLARHGMRALREAAR